MDFSLSDIKPSRKPNRPYFSSGPCVKPLDWHSSAIDSRLLGRSHRSKEGIALIQSVADKIRNLLSVPCDYKIAIVPGSATGACEMAFWNFLGCRPVDVFSWDVFSKKWLSDIRDRLKIDHRSFDADFGQVPDFFAYDPDHDCCFVWSGTTAGVTIPHMDWIPVDRQGLVICDATSAMFSFAPPWEKLDVIAFSFQKVLGGEAGHGVLILSPRALERLNTYTPPWPIPALLSLTYETPEHGNRVQMELFEGKGNNTPSLWCIADAAYCLEWMQSIGGLSGIISKADQNYAALARWVAQSQWVQFLAADEVTRSKLAVTLVPSSPAFIQASVQEKWAILTSFCNLLGEHQAAYDIKGHALAVPNLRIWCGPTVELQDIEALLPWLDYAAARTGLVEG